MIKKLLLGGPGVLAGAYGVLYGWTVLRSIPLLRRLPRPDRVTLAGVTTIADAVAACKRTGLGGWDLVAYAQRLAARKFTYSRLNPWDSPARAFARGRGYCQQQALALKAIYDGLGIATRPVFALRCRFPAKIVDGVPWPGGVSPHTWLHVRIGADERDVCPGARSNTPGVTHFAILSPVHTLYPWLRPLTHLGSVLENIRRDREARRVAR